MVSYLNNYSDPSSVPREVCLLVAATLRHPLYRIAQIITLTESIAAVICIAYILYTYQKTFVCHKNIEILLYALYLSCLGHAIDYSIAKIYQLYVSFFVMDECEMFLPRMFYIPTHIIIVFTNCCMQNMQIVLIIERFVATVLVDTYETLYQSLGTVLVTILVLVTTVEVGIGYETLFANVLMTNSMLHSDVKSNAVTITFIVISIISCLSLFITFSLYCYNSRREKRKTLTSRYQTLENISMSALLCIISVIQLVTFAIYASSMTYLRMRLMDHPLLDAYKELAYLVPLNTFLIPIGTLIFFKVSKRNRRYASINLINMKTQGDEGWQNYSKLLNRQWK